MVKIAVAALLLLVGLIVMGKARGPASLMGFVLFIAGIIGAVSLSMTPTS